MSQLTVTVEAQVVKFHDLFLELGRVELLLDKMANQDAANHERALQCRRSKLQQELSLLEA